MLRSVHFDLFFVIGTVGRVIFMEITVKIRIRSVIFTGITMIFMLLIVKRTVVYLFLLL